MSIVIPANSSKQSDSQQSARLLNGFKNSQNVSYYSSRSYDGSKFNRPEHQGLEIVIPSLLKTTDTTKKGLKASFADDVSFLRLKPLIYRPELGKSLPSPADNEDVLDWDFHLENPPLKPTKTIEVELHYGGRSKPIPISDPWDE